MMQSMIAIRVSLCLSIVVSLCTLAYPQALTSPVQYKELAAFKKNGDGEVWRNVAVSPKVKRDELIALAKFLRHKYPLTPIRIFTDDDNEKFEEFMRWDIHYPNDAYPPPREWLRKHGIAKIQATSNDGGRTWHWLLWPVSTDSYKFVPAGAEVIAELP